jgi:hypothetical protein
LGDVFWVIGIDFRRRKIFGIADKMEVPERTWNGFCGFCPPLSAGA